ncbi:MAG: GrpB family protein [Pseudonocardiaceae bacterium]|nr:GrpB family protein [Pseudonocardiaceae bacterium]
MHDGAVSNPAGSSWPVWATEPVEVVAPDPHWADRGPALAGELDGLLAPWLVAAVEHVGSTAVPGLRAKPVLDLMAAVADPAAMARDAAEPLQRAGWELVPPELDGRAWRRLFVKPDMAGRRRVAHLHVMRPDEPRRAQLRLFRDRLRADPGLADRYAALKATLAARHPDDRERYTAAKARFVEEVLRG